MRREESACWTLAASYRHCEVFSNHTLDYLAPNRVSQHVTLTSNNLKLIKSNLGTSRRSFSSQWQLLQWIILQHMGSNLSVYKTQYLVRLSNECLGFDQFKHDAEEERSICFWKLATSYRHPMLFSNHNIIQPQIEYHNTLHSQVTTSS